jgi:hypothetical protein
VERRRILGKCGVGWGGVIDLLGTHAAALSHHSSYFLSRDFVFLIGVGVTHFCPPREISIPNCLDHPIHFCSSRMSYH